MLLVIPGVIFLTLFTLIPAVAAQVVGSLPAVGGLLADQLDQDMLIFDRHGALLADVRRSGTHRIVVPLSQISIQGREGAHAEPLPLKHPLFRQAQEKRIASILDGIRPRIVPNGSDRGCRYDAFFDGWK